MNAKRMTSFKLALALLFLAAPHAVGAQGAGKTDVSGMWLFSVVTDNGTGTPTVTFAQKGDSITGHYSSQLLGELDFKGTVKDGNVRWTMSLSAEGQALTVTYVGTVEGADAMKGTVDFGGMGSGTFTGKRQK